MLDTKHPIQRLLSMLNVASPQAIISESACGLCLQTVLQAQPAIHHVFLLSAKEPFSWACSFSNVRFHNVDQQLQSSPSWRIDGNDPCYLHFTSGSTGEPKAVLGRTQGLAHFIKWEINTFALTRHSIISQLSRPTFDVYLRDIFCALCTGGMVAIPPSRDIVLEPEVLAHWIEQAEVTLIHCVPTVFRQLLMGDLSKDCFPALKQVLLAGESLLPSDVNRWVGIFGSRIELVNLYGPTETTLAKFYYRLPGRPVEGSFVPIGQPISGCQAILLRDDLQPCVRGEVGEIYIRTPFRSLGYYGRADLTEAVFVQNPFRCVSEDLLYKTGDFAIKLTDGNYRLMGRRDLQIKIRGNRVELGEIETALEELTNVAHAVVTANKAASGDYQLTAYLVLINKDAEFEVPAVRYELSRLLLPHMVPTAYVFIEALPLTPNGKVDRKALSALDGAVHATQEYEAPQGETEERLAQIWSELLGVERVGRRDNFFELGAHSLLAVRLISRIRQDFRIEVPLQTIFKALNISELGKYIDICGILNAPSPGEFLDEQNYEDGVI